MTSGSNGRRPRVAIRTVRIATRDGLSLNGQLYEPRDQSSPAPGIVAITPYGADHLHDRGMFFAGRGLPFLAVDVRGRGDSEGVFRPHVRDAEDGHDVVEWLACQRCCDGQVGMYGGSYLGSAQWATATTLPPHLKCITPTAAPYNGVDVPMRGNIFSAYELRWLTLVSGRHCQTKRFADESYWTQHFRHWYESGQPFRRLDRLVGEPCEIFQEYLRHPEVDAYWDSLNPTQEDYARMDLPILTITGIYDGDQLGALEHYRQHVLHGPATARDHHYLVIGPWNHTGCTLPSSECDGLKIGDAGVLDLYELHAAWYAWILQGGEKPALLKDRVTYYVTGAECWRYAPTLESVTARYEPLYLQSEVNASDVLRSGSLATHPPAESPPDSYIYDPRDVSGAELESGLDPTRWIVDQRLVYAAGGKQLVYHSAPFESDVEISGFFRFVAWIAIDQPDTDFQIAIYEIDAQGGSIHLASDRLRARYRKSLREPSLIDTLEPLRYEFNRFNFTSRLIEKGHRMRLVIGPVNSIREQKNFNSGATVADEAVQDARPVAVTLFHDRTHPSALFLPMGRG